MGLSELLHNLLLKTFSACFNLHILGLPFALRQEKQILEHCFFHVKNVVMGRLLTYSNEGKYFVSHLFLCINSLTFVWKTLLS